MRCGGHGTLLLVSFIVLIYFTSYEGSDSAVGYTPAFMAAAAGSIPFHLPVRLSNPAHSTRSIVHRKVVGVPGLLNFRTGCVLECSFAQNA